MNLHNETLALFEALQNGSISEAEFIELAEEGYLDAETLDYIMEASIESDIGIKSLDKSEGSRSEIDASIKELAKQALDDYIDKAVAKVNTPTSVVSKEDVLSKIIASKALAGLKA